MPGAEQLASRIAGQKRERRIDCTLEKLLFLEYFAPNTGDSLLQSAVRSNSLKEIACADYCGVGLDRGLPYNCCLHLPMEDTASYYSPPQPEDLMAAAVYINELRHGASKRLSQKAVNIKQLKEVLLIDLLLDKCRHSADANRTIRQSLDDLALIYRNSRNNNRFSTALAKAKYPLLALSAASLLGIAVFSGINCYTNMKAKDNDSYEQKLEQLADCDNHLIADEYKSAFECGKSLSGSVSDDAHYYNGPVRQLSISLMERVQQDMYSDYSLKLEKSEAQLYQGHYDSAIALCDSIEEQLSAAEFFSKKNEIISKANALEEKIIAKKGEERPPQSGNNFFGSIGDYISSGYSRIHSLFVLLGMGETGADIASALLVFLPVYGIAKRIRKRLKQ